MIKKIITVKKNYENKYEIEYDGKKIDTLTSNTYKAYLDDYMLLIDETSVSTVSDTDIINTVRPQLNNLINHRTKQSIRGYGFKYHY